MRKIETDHVLTTADVSRQRGAILLRVPVCRHCGADANRVTSTQGAVRYLKCRACRTNDKISTGRAAVLKE